MHKFAVMLGVLSGLRKQALKWQGRPETTNVENHYKLGPPMGPFLSHKTSMTGPGMPNSAPAPTNKIPQVDFLKDVQIPRAMYDTTQQMNLNPTQQYKPTQQMQTPFK